MAIVEISVVPLGTGDAGISRYVAGCLKVLQEERELRFQLTPMGTVIEGNLDLIFKTIRKMHEEPFLAGAPRVLTTIRVDDRRDKEITMSGKVSSVEKKLSGRV
ncbi:MAG: MTH1187 family thiamine-binding protein [Bacillota bacterium]